MKRCTLNGNPAFSPSGVKVLSWTYIVMQWLSSFRFVEVAFSMFAIGYGASLGIGGNIVMRPTEYIANVPLVATYPKTYGTLIFICGIVAFVGVVRKLRCPRLCSNMGLAILWAGLAAHYFFTEPPIFHGFISLAFASAMQFCIFIRVYADLNSHWHHLAKERKGV